MNFNEPLTKDKKKRAIELVKSYHKMPLLYKMNNFVTREMITKGGKENPYEKILKSIMEAEESAIDGYYSGGAEFILYKWEELLKRKLQ